MLKNTTGNGDTLRRGVSRAHSMGQGELVVAPMPSPSYRRRSQSEWIPLSPLNLRVFRSQSEERGIRYETGGRRGAQPIIPKPTNISDDMCCLMHEIYVVFAILCGFKMLIDSQDKLTGECAGTLVYILVNGRVNPQTDG